MNNRAKRTTRPSRSTLPRAIHERAVQVHRMNEMGQFIEAYLTRSVRSFYQYGLGGVLSS